MEDKKACSLDGCTREVFEDSDKCILHCEKDDWYQVDPKTKEMDWSFYKENIEKFLEAFIYAYNNFETSQEVFEFIGIHFPKLEEPNDNFIVNFIEFIDEKDQHLSFYNCVFYSELKINSLYNNNILFDDSVFHGAVKLNEKTDTAFTSCIFKGSLYLIGNIKLDIEGCTIDNDIKAYFTNFEDFRILLSDVRNIDLIRCDIYNQFSVEFQCNIERLKLYNCNLDKNANVQLIESKISFLELESNKFNCNINIKDLDIMHILFKNQNIGALVIDNCNFTKTKLRIENSNLISNSEFVILNSVYWPPIDNFICNRDTFRQLKLVNDKQANYIEANKFYSAEMDEYKKEITSKNSNGSYQERFIFWMNYLVSDFGRSWIQPLIWYLIMGSFLGHLFYQGHFSIPFLCITIVSIVGFAEFIKRDNRILNVLPILLIPSLLGYFSKSIAGVDKFTNQLNSLIQFMNPFDTNRKPEEGTNFGWWILFLLFGVFIIYQFIISLRRQTKR